MNADHRCPPAAPRGPPSELTGRILQAFFEVHWEIGHGYLESVYARALRVALGDLQLLVEAEARIPVHSRGRVIGCFRADLLVERSVMVEVKAMPQLEPRHTAQLLNYLRATDVEVGLLLNFAPRATFKRLAFRNERKASLRSSAYFCGPHRPATVDPRESAVPPAEHQVSPELDAPRPPSPV